MERHAHDRWIACAAAVLAVSACGLFKDEQGADGADATGGDGAQTAATGFATLLGVGSYALSPGPGETTDLRIALLGSGGRELGVIDVYADAAGLSASMPSPDGLVEYHLSARVEGDRLLTSRRFGTAAFQLTLESESLIDAAGELSEVRAVLLAPGDPLAVELADPVVSADNDVVSLVLFGADGEAAFGRLAGWFQAVVPEELQRSPELLRLVAAMLDPALVSALEASAAGSFAPTSMPGALHLSPECRALRDKVHADAIAPCRACAQLDPNRTAPVPAGVNWGPLALPYVPDCRKCALANNVKEADIASCVKAWRRSKDIWTDERCARERLDYAAFGHVAVATPDGHGCQLGCRIDTCTAFCNRWSAALRNVPVAPSCESLGCLCHPDYDAFCAQLHPGTNCGVRTMVEACEVSVCGDGRITSRCPADPNLIEVCDTARRSGDGCASGSRCAGDCRSCLPCECGQDADCATGLVCDGCRCKEAACNNLLDLIGDEGQWCDAREGERWCGPDRPCDAATCRCQEQAQETCGNQALDVGETCDASAAVTGCGAGSKCLACERCQALCGNGYIDDGEACDPASADICGAGMACSSSCTCEPTAPVECGSGCTPCIGGSGVVPSLTCATLNPDTIIAPGIAGANGKTCYAADRFSCCSIGSESTYNKICDTEVTPVCFCCIAPDPEMTAPYVGCFGPGFEGECSEGTTPCQ